MTAILELLLTVTDYCVTVRGSNERFKARWYFGIALIAERNGNLELAEAELKRAVEAEDALSISPDQANEELMKFLEEV